MRFQILPITLLFFSTLASCHEAPSPAQSEENEVKDLREEALQLQKETRKMRPSIEAEAQETIESVEKRVEKSHSP